MKRLVASVSIVVMLTGGGVVATGAAAQARDTGWDCPGCRHATR